MTEVTRKLKTEYLILAPGSDVFCSSKRSFVDLLNVDALLSVSGNSLSYKRHEKSKELISAKYHVETDKVKDKDERFFLLVLECSNSSSVDDFSELCERVKSIVERIFPGHTAINTLWDGVGSVYAERSYPVINEVENLMRRLIAKFMLINVGMNWSKDAMNAELFKKIENYEDEEVYLNDLHKLDFINLKQVLFDKKRDISLEDLDRTLSKDELTPEDLDKIKKFLPKSNWEKYFSSLLNVKDRDLEKKWELLYKLRNKVAHNRNVKKDEFDKILGLANDIKQIIQKATEKLGEIRLDDEDRELILHSYQSESSKAFEYGAEKYVIEHYSLLGYDIANTNGTYAFDFIAHNDKEVLAVDVKSIQLSRFNAVLRYMAMKHLDRFRSEINVKRFSKIHLVCVLVDDGTEYPLSRIRIIAKTFSKKFGNSIEIHIGKIDEEEGIYLPI